MDKYDFDYEDEEEENNGWNDYEEEVYSAEEENEDAENYLDDGADLSTVNGYSGEFSNGVL